jgi:hypothetical protein
MKLNEYKTTESYKATGAVYGNFWGGVSSSYPSITIEGGTLDEIKHKANKALEDGSIDSGIGYESIKGALLNVVEITTIDVEGHTFTNESESELIVGELTDAEKDFLRDYMSWY